MRKGKVTLQTAAAALLGAYVAVLLWITVLGRDPQTAANGFAELSLQRMISLWKDVFDRGLTGNFLGNIALFLPVGFLVPMASDRKKSARVLLTGLIVSLLLETLQLVTGRGVFDVADVLLNFTGTAAGLIIYRCFLLGKRRMEKEGRD